MAHESRRQRREDEELVDELVAGVIIVIIILVTALAVVLYMRRTVSLSIGPPGPTKYGLSSETAKVLGVANKISTVPPKTAAPHLHVVQDPATNTVIVQKTAVQATPVAAATTITASGAQTPRFLLVVPLTPLDTGVLTGMMMNLRYQDDAGQTQTAQLLADTGSGTLVVPQVPNQQAGNNRRWTVRYISQTASGFIDSLKNVSYDGSAPSSALAGLSTAIVPTGEQLPFFIHGLAPCNGDVVSVINQLSIRTLAVILEPRGPHVTMANYDTDLLAANNYVYAGTIGLNQASHYNCIPSSISFVCDDGATRTWTTVYAGDGSPPYTQSYDSSTNTTQKLQNATMTLIWDTGTTLPVLATPMSPATPGAVPPPPNPPNVRAMTVVTPAVPQTPDVIEAMKSGQQVPMTTVSFDFSQFTQLAVPMPSLLQYGQSTIVGLIAGINAMKQYNWHFSIDANGFPTKVDLYQLRS